MAYEWGASNAPSGAGTRSARVSNTIEAFYLRDEKGQYVAQELHGVKKTITATVVANGQNFTLGGNLGGAKITKIDEVYSNTDWKVYEISAETFEADPA